jgi:1-phosphatidylinositol phosphodiesterase
LYETFSGTAKCQDLTIDNQLNAGVRFLDIRCRHINDAFAIHHGSVYQHMNFDDVLSYCHDFLATNPTECIIMSVKEEYDATNITRTFEETFDSYVAKGPGSWYLGATIPELGSVRGKIVLFRRFSSTSTPKGIDATNWKDDATFEINNGNARLKIQDDYYVTDTDEKWNAITSLLGEAKSGSSQILYINFTSGYKPLIFGIPSITSVSSVINPWVSGYFTSNTTGRYGILSMDFVNEERSTSIIETNF